MRRLAAVWLLLATAPAGAQLAEHRCNGPVPARFELRDDGTARDPATGLIWSRCMLGQTLVDGQCGPDRAWYIQHRWDQAQSAVKALRLAGHADWRLPTLDELETLVEPRCSGPAIDLKAFPGTHPARFWTQTPEDTNPEYIWRVDFNTGASGSELRANANYLGRAVRGVAYRVARPAPPPPPAEPGAPGVHDAGGPGMALLQSPAEGLGALPRWRDGSTDWVAALRGGAIAPRHDLLGATAPAPVDLDILMTDTRDMPVVRFPHRTHSEWLACSNCHPAPFAERANGTPITMNAILQGEYCGLCHGRVAFSTMLCERCHNTPAKP